MGVHTIVKMKSLMASQLQDEILTNKVWHESSFEFQRMKEPHTFILRYHQVPNVIICIIYTRAKSCGGNSVSYSVAGSYKLVCKENPECNLELTIILPHAYFVWVKKEWNWELLCLSDPCLIQVRQRPSFIYNAWPQNPQTP